MKPRGWFITSFVNYLASWDTLCTSAKIKEPLDNFKEISLHRHAQLSPMPINSQGVCMMLTHVMYYSRNPYYSKRLTGNHRLWICWWIWTLMSLMKAFFIMCLCVIAWCSLYFAFNLWIFSTFYWVAKTFREIKPW